MIKQTYEDNDTVTYLYDNDGILSTVKDSASGIKTKYYYDFAGRLVKYTEDGSNNNLDHTVAYVYDEKDQVTQRKSTALGSTWTVTTDYDEDGRITSATQSNVSREFTYDNKNRLTSTTLKRDSTDALITSYIYKANTAMLSTVKLENAAGNKGSWQYLYDDNGNITRIITTVNDARATTYYHYDTAGQLIREDNQKAGTTTLWTYDNAGNILTEKVYAHTTGTPSTLRKTNTYTYTSTQWGDLLTSYNGNMIYYDGLTELGKFQVGNPTTYYNGTAWTFTWEHGRQLATITQTSTGTTWTNTYNSDGLRTSRSDGTTTYTYIYEDGRLSAIKRNDLNMWIIYDDNGPVTLKYGAGTFHYVTNPQGDVVAIVGNQGQKLVEYTYDAWGKVTSITGDYAYNLGVHNPILYRGYIYDHETGLYYCQSRYYDPETGRFLNADGYTSTGGLLGNNMFAYCGNNPVNYADPYGTEKYDAMRNQFAAIFLGNHSGGAGGGIAIVGGSALAGLIGNAAQATASFFTSVFREVHEFSTMMREELAEALKSRPHVHHIAPYGSFSTRSDTTIQNLKEIRELFISAEINIYIDPMNLMLVSAKTHASLHTDSYISDVHDRLMSTDGSKWEIYGVLFWLRLEIAAKDAYAIGY